MQMKSRLARGHLCLRLVIGSAVAGLGCQALSAPAELGGKYVEIYNILARMHTNRYYVAKDQGTSQVAVKSPSSTVSQSDLDKIRDEVVNTLLDAHYLVNPDNFNLGEEQEANAFPFGRSFTEGTLNEGSQMAGVGDGNGLFTKVPAEYTSDGVAQYAKTFASGPPPLWIHFKELHTVLSRMRYTRENGSWTANSENNTRDVLGSNHSDQDWETSKQLSEDDYEDEGTLASVDASPGAQTRGRYWLGFYRSGMARRYAYYQVTGLDACEHKVRFYNRGSSETTWDDYGDASQVKQGQWFSWDTKGPVSQSTSMSAKLGQLTKPSPWSDEPISDEWISRGYALSGAEAVIEWVGLYSKPISNPAVDDWDEDGLVDFHECERCLKTCPMKAATEKQHMLDFPNADFPLGISSGLATGGLEIKAYVTEYDVGGTPKQMFSLDTKKVSWHEDTEESKWEFVVIRRPSGAEVLFSLKGAKAGHPVNVNRSYRVEKDGDDYELKFAGPKQVVHRFDSSGNIDKVRAILEHHPVEVDGSPTAWPQTSPTLTVNKSGSQITSVECAIATATPTYDLAGDLIVSVEYSDPSDNTTHSLVITNGSRRLILKDEDGHFLSETRIVTTNGSTEIWYGVDSNGVVQAKDIRTDSYSVTNDTMTVIDITLLGPDGASPHSNTTSRIFEPFPWDVELTSQTAGYGGADPQVTRYSYWTDPTVTNSYSKLKLIERPDGSWIRYDYDEQGRHSEVYTPFEDSVPTAATNECHATYYYYASNSVLPGLSFPVADDAAVTNDHRPRLVVEQILGTEISRTYNVYFAGSNVTKRCLVAGAAYTHASNLVTITEAYTSGTYEGRRKKITQPDGTLSVYTYLYDGTAETLTTTNRTGSGSGVSVTNGIETVTVIDAGERVLSELRRDIVSEVTISHTVYTRDAFGRPTVVSNALNGTFSTKQYDCCGVESMTDFDGIQTFNMAHDWLGRTISRTRGDVTTDMIYDSHGSVVETRRQATGFNDIVTYRVSDEAGRLAHATNELGNGTSYAYSTNGSGGRIVTTTNPDSTTRIEAYYRDGRLKSVSGTSAHPVCYDHGADSTGRYTIEYRGSTTNATEWVKTYTDMLGRTAKVVYPNSYTNHLVYDAAGRLTRQSDGFTATLTAYDDLGDAFRTAVDMDGDDTIDLSGPDRVSESETSYATVSGKEARESVSRTYATSGSGTPTEVSLSRSAVDGSANWSIAFDLTNHTAVVRDPSSGTRTETLIRPDGNQSVSSFSSNQLTSVVWKTSTGATVSTDSYTYDAFGRRATVIQTAPNGQTHTTTYGYNKAGNVTNMTVSAGKRPVNPHTVITVDLR